MLYFGQVGVLAVAYFTAAKLSLFFAIPPGYATAVWPPSGIALAAVLVLGIRVWPGIWVGAALVNFTVDASYLAAAVIATGNTLEALAGAAMIRYFLGVPHRFERGEDVIAFVAASVLSATIAATVGLTPLAITHSQSWPELFLNWWTWWQGDVAGMIVVAPLILSWCSRGTVVWTPQKLLEGVFFASLLLITAWAVFGSEIGIPDRYPMKFLMVPFIIWAAFRFGQREVTGTTAAVCIIAIWDTIASGGTASPELNETLLVLLAYNCTLAITGLVLGAVVCERSRAMDELRSSRDELELRVHERTAEVERANLMLTEDIAARERTEKALQDSERWFRLMFEAAPDAIALVDQAGRIRRVNAQAEAMFGYRGDELAGKGIEILLPERFHERHVRHRKGYSADPRVRPMGAGLELLGRRRDGREFPVDIMLSPVETAEGRLVLSVVRDVTERKRAESELVKAKAAAEEATRAKSIVLAKMSHDFRTPLNTVLVLARILGENAGKNLTPKQIEYAELISAAGRDLLALIAEILRAARSESGVVSTVFSLAPVRFSELQAHVERTFRDMAHDKGLQFTIMIEPGLPPAVPTDIQRLQRILNNLLLNALKFTDEGGVSLRIAPAASGWSAAHAQLNASDGVVAFSVVDTGIGIPQDKQSIIFEQFQQADSVTATEYGGTGLGLAISRELAELLGGEITVSSSRGKGSTFTLYLPLARNA